MAETSKMLGQQTPTTTTAITLYDGSAASSTAIQSLRVCNTDIAAGATASCRVFFNDAGNNYDATNAVLYDKTVNGKGTLAISLGSLNGTGTIGVRSSSANALTFTLFGTETTA